MITCRGDDPLDRFGKTAGADRSPVVVPKTDAAAHEVIGDLQIIIVGTIEVREVDRGRIREREIADRIKLGESDHRASTADFSLHRRGGAGRDKERSERAQKAGCRDIKFGLELIKMLIAAFSGDEMHEVPGKKWIGQGQVGMNACDRKPPS